MSLCSDSEPGDLDRIASQQVLSHLVPWLLSWTFLNKMEPILQTWKAWKTWKNPLILPRRAVHHQKHVFSPIQIFTCSEKTRSDINLCSWILRKDYLNYHHTNFGANWTILRDRNCRFTTPLSRIQWKLTTLDKYQDRTLRNSPAAQIQV